MPADEILYSDWSGLDFNLHICLSFEFVCICFLPLEKSLPISREISILKKHVFSSICRRGNETSFVPARRSAGRRVIENADGSEEEVDARDADFNGTKASE